MEYILLVILMVINVLLIKRKFDKSRTSEGIIDTIIISLLMVILHATIAGLLVALIIAFFSSLYLSKKPIDPYQFRNRKPPT